MAIKEAPRQTAWRIAKKCEEMGWIFFVRGSIFTIVKNFTPNDSIALVNCDNEYYDILSLLPRSKAGSDWGTDCGGIGALSALSSGCFTMNRSGGNKFVLKALQALTQNTPT